MKPDRLNEYKNGINYYRNQSQQMKHNINQNRRQAFERVVNKRSCKR